MRCNHNSYQLYINSVLKRITYQYVAMADLKHNVGGWFKRFKWINTTREETLNAESKLLNISGCKDVLQQKDTSIQYHGSRLSLHSVEGGPVDAPALVYLPGYGAGVGFIFRILKGLTNGFSLYAVDLLGTGLSSRPSPFWPKSTKEAEAFFVDSLEEWRKVRNIDSFILVGHSMGGYLAACYAMSYPERVKHLVMVCPAGVGAKAEDWSPPSAVKSPWTLRGQLYRLATTMWTSGVTPGSIIRFLGPYGKELVRGYTQRRFIAGHHLTQEEVDIFAQYMYGIVAAKGSGEHALRYILEPFAFAKDPLEHRMSNLQTPVSFIYGSQDWMDPLAADRLLERIRENRGSLVEGDLERLTTECAGHYPYLDQPGMFLKDLMAVCGSYCQSEEAKRLVMMAADEYPLSRDGAIDTKEDLEEEGPATAAAHIASDM